MRISVKLAIISLLFVSATARVLPPFENNPPKFTEEIIRIDVDEQPLFPQDSEGRILAVQTYPQIRIATDYSLLTSGNSTLISYIQTQLMPPVVNYFQAALKVKQPLVSPLKLSASTTVLCGGYATPKALLNGVSNADFYLLVTTQSDTVNNWVASAGSCFAATSGRPLIARMIFNLVYTVPAVGDVMTHERNTYLTIHEMFHAFGFSSSNFASFIDANGKTLANPMKQVSVGGVVRTFLDVEPLTTNLRNFYGCTSMPGALLEDDGGSGTANDHFERRAFLYEVMTSGVITGYRVSNFSLNVLEGSGWYVPDYSYAEPFYFGQGEGCNFIYDNCSGTGNGFSEFCATTGPVRGCSDSGRGGGVCATDTRSDGCYYFFPMSNYDCEDTTAAADARLPNVEKYGRSAGSRCFSGTLTTLSKASQASFCFTYTCSGSSLNTEVTVNVGTQSIACKKAGSMTVTGYNGVITCPDPLTFCSTVGKKYCPRNCMGKGTCNNNVCTCNAGFSGIDCGIVGTWGN